MRRTFSFVAVACVAALCVSSVLISGCGGPSAGGAPPASDAPLWGDVGGDYAHSGRGTGVVSNAPSLHWTRELAHPGYTRLPVVASDGRIVTTVQSRATNDSWVIAINPDGTEAWTRQYPDAKSAPVIGPDGTIYLAASGSLEALTPAGETMWNAPADVGGSMWMSKGLPLLPASSAGVRAFDANGGQRWALLLEPSSPTQFVAYAEGPDASTYLAATSGDFVRVDSAGKQLWKIALTGMAPLIHVAPDGTAFTAALGEDGKWTTFAITPAGKKKALAKRSVAPGFLGITDESEALFTGIASAGGAHTVTALKADGGSRVVYHAAADEQILSGFVDDLGLLVILSQRTASGGAGTGTMLSAVAPDGTKAWSVDVAVPDGMAGRGIVLGDNGTVLLTVSSSDPAIMGGPNEKTSIMAFGTP